MKVKFLMAIAGGINANQGDIVELNETKAKALIDAEICELYIEEEKKEKRIRIHKRSCSPKLN